MIFFVLKCRAENNGKHWKNAEFYPKEKIFQVPFAMNRTSDGLVPVKRKEGKS